MINLLHVPTDARARSGIPKLSPMTFHASAHLGRDKAVAILAESKGAVRNILSGTAKASEIIEIKPEPLAITRWD